MIACMAIDEEKPYHLLEKCAQNGADQLVVSCDFLPCEDFLARCEESDPEFKELCRLLERVNCWGCMEGALAVPNHRLLHMESF